MISIRIDLSTLRAGHDPILAVTSWISSIMQEEAIDGMVVHNITVEQADA